MATKKNEFDSALISRFLTSRRTTREFLPKHVSQTIINQILTDALTAPSWSNTRPFKVAVAKGEVRDRISAEFLSRWGAVSKHLRAGTWGKFTLLVSRYGLPTSNRFISKPYSPDLKPRAHRLGAELYKSFGIAREDRLQRDAWWAKNYEFFGAPVELFIYIHKSLGIHAASDAGLMMENLALSAHARGLGTCMQGSVAIWDDVIRKEFDVPENYRLLCGIAVGYPSPSKVNDFKAHRIGVDEILLNPSV